MRSIAHLKPVAPTLRCLQRSRTSFRLAAVKGRAFIALSSSSLGQEPSQGVPVPSTQRTQDKQPDRARGRPYRLKPPSRETVRPPRFDSWHEACDFLLVGGDALTPIALVELCRQAANHRSGRRQRERCGDGGNSHSSSTSATAEDEQQQKRQFRFLLLTAIARAASPIGGRDAAEALCALDDLSWRLPSEPMRRLLDEVSSSFGTLRPMQLAQLACLAADADQSVAAEAAAAAATTADGDEGVAAVAAAAGAAGRREGSGGGGGPAEPPDGATCLSNSWWDAMLEALPYPTLAALTPQRLVHVVIAVCERTPPPSGWMVGAVRALKPATLQQLGAADLSRLLAAVAAVHVPPGGTGPPARWLLRSWLLSWLRCAAPLLKRFDLHQLFATAIALVQVRHRPSDVWLQLLLRSLHAQLLQADSALQLLELTVALARLRCRLPHALATRLCHRLEHLLNQAASSSCSSSAIFNSNNSSRNSSSKSDLSADGTSTHGNGAASTRSSSSSSSSSSSRFGVPSDGAVADPSGGAVAGLIGGAVAGLSGGAVADLLHALLQVSQPYTRWLAPQVRPLLLRLVVVTSGTSGTRDEAGGGTSHAVIGGTPRAVPGGTPQDARGTPGGLPHGATSGTPRVFIGETPHAISGGAPQEVTVTSSASPHGAASETPRAFTGGTPHAASSGTPREISVTSRALPHGATSGTPHGAAHRMPSGAASGTLHGAASGTPHGAASGTPSRYPDSMPQATIMAGGTSNAATGGSPSEVAGGMPSGAIGGTPLATTSGTPPGGTLLERCSPYELVRLVDGFVQFNYYPGADWMRAHRAACILKQAQFTERERQRLRAAYARVWQM